MSVIEDAVHVNAACPHSPDRRQILRRNNSVRFFGNRYLSIPVFDGRSTAVARNETHKHDHHHVIFIDINLETYDMNQSDVRYPNRRTC